ncbi:MAG TPA: hypothetical protein VML96_02585 [Egibacteraceae bacterium]|nr:hypothetical protein [Egibacteraceae bacterium]
MTAYQFFVGALLAAGLVSVVWTLPRVPPWWRPLYWLAIPLAAVPLLLVAAALAENLYRRAFLPADATQLSLQFVMLILALELILVPLVHRREAALRGDDDAAERRRGGVDPGDRAVRVRGGDESPQDAGGEGARVPSLLPVEGRARDLLLSRKRTAHVARGPRPGWIVLGRVAERRGGRRS